MTRDGIKKCLAILQANYPNTYSKLAKEDLLCLISIWELHFKDFDDVMVFSALNNTLSTFSFPPTIADIKRAMIPNNSYNAEEVWAVLLDAGRDGIYGAEEQWNNLPEEIKAITTPTTIREIAMSSDESLQYIKRDILNAYGKHFEKSINDRLVYGIEHDSVGELPFFKEED